MARRAILGLAVSIQSIQKRGIVRTITTSYVHFLSPDCPPSAIVTLFAFIVQLTRHTTLDDALLRPLLRGKLQTLSKIGSNTLLSPEPVIHHMRTNFKHTLYLIFLHGTLLLKTVGYKMFYNTVRFFYI
jgi:hypothetical protein